MTTKRFDDYNADYVSIGDYIVVNGWTNAMPWCNIRDGIQEILRVSHKNNATFEVKNAFPLPDRERKNHSDGHCNHRHDKTKIHFPLNCQDYPENWHKLTKQELIDLREQNLIAYNNGESERQEFFSHVKVCEIKSYTVEF
jgi:hypothetical protein